MVELYQDTLVDLLLPKNMKRLKLDIKKDSKVIAISQNWYLIFVISNLVWFDCHYWSSCITYYMIYRVWFLLKM
jgi:hypothetical protein